MNQVNERKLEIARAQLGTALHLFLLDRDPYSVHALACGGCELIEGLAESVQLPTLSTHIIETFPDLEKSQIVGRRTLYWNAIKHYYRRPESGTVRDDDALLADFSDQHNDVPLFAGWCDYFRVTRKLPIEAQVFHMWWHALYEDKLAPDVDPTRIRAVFPDIGHTDRAEQKRRLRRTIQHYRHNRALLEHPSTERDSLLRRT